MRLKHQIPKAKVDRWRVALLERMPTTWSTRRQIFRAVWPFVKLTTSGGSELNRLRFIEKLDDIKHFPEIEEMQRPGQFNKFRRIA